MYTWQNAGHCFYRMATALEYIQNTDTVNREHGDPGGFHLIGLTVFIKRRHS